MTKSRHTPVGNKCPKFAPIAVAVVTLQGIAVDDLFTPMKGHPELHSDNIHFNPQGTAIQGQQVASEIEKLLTK